MQANSAKRSALIARSALLAGVLTGVLVTTIAIASNVASDAEDRSGKTAVAPTPMAQDLLSSAQGAANDNLPQGAMDQADELWAREVPNRPPPAPLPPEVMPLREDILATPAERIAEEARMAEVARNFDD